MATPNRSIRLDEVWAEIAKLRKVYGTDNAAMRFAFGLTGETQVKSLDVTKPIPTVVLKKMPPDLSADSVTRPSKPPLLKPKDRK